MRTAAAKPARARRAGGVIDPDTAAMMARMLAAVVSRGTGRAAAVPGRTVAGKTGTTQDYRDAWFIGWIDGDAHRGVAGQRRRHADESRPGRVAAGAAVSRHRGNGTVMR